LKPPDVVLSASATKLTFIFKLFVPSVAKSDELVRAMSASVFLFQLVNGAQTWVDEPIKAEVPERFSNESMV
jgi:hypothetical protein